MNLNFTNIYKNQNDVTPIEENILPRISRKPTLEEKTWSNEKILSEIFSNKNVLTDMTTNFTIREFRKNATKTQVLKSGTGSKFPPPQVNVDPRTKLIDIQIPATGFDIILDLSNNIIDLNYNNFTFAEEPLPSKEQVVGFFSSIFHSIFSCTKSTSVVVTPPTDAPTNPIVVPPTDPLQVPPSDPLPVPINPLPSVPTDSVPPAPAQQS